MINTKRFVNIRGYICHVLVIDLFSPGEWLVEYGKRRERVPEYLFYHSSPTGLILRESLEFKRLYPNHKVEDVNVSM